MSIKAGDALPAGKFKVMGEGGPQDLTSDQLFKGKRVVLFSVPGAFTPTCNAKHLPGYLQHADALKAKGVDTIACIAVNDVFVMGQWGKESGADGKIVMLSDDGAFTKAIGLDIDLSGAGLGLGLRSKRYAMLVDNGVVKVLNVEDAPPNLGVSSAETVCSLVDRSF